MKNNVRLARLLHMLRILSLLLIAISATSSSSGGEPLTPSQEAFLALFKKGIDENNVDILATVSCFDGLSPYEVGAMKILLLEGYLKAVRKIEHRAYSFHEMDDVMKQFIKQQIDYKCTPTLTASQALRIDNADEPATAKPPLQMVLGESGGKLLIVCFHSDGK